MKAAIQTLIDLPLLILWGLAMAVVGLMLLPLSLSFPPTLRGWFYFSNNALSLTAILLNLEGVFQYRLRPAGTRWIWWTMLGAMVLALLFLWSSEDSPRQIVFGFVSGLLLLSTSAALIWRVEETERFANAIAASVCVVMAVAVLVRAGARVIDV